MPRFQKVNSYKPNSVSTVNHGNKYAPERLIAATLKLPNWEIFGNRLALFEKIVKQKPGKLPGKGAADGVSGFSSQPAIASLEVGSDNETAPPIAIVLALSAGDLRDFRHRKRATLRARARWG
jgi:hypothetical protein